MCVCGVWKWKRKKEGARHIGERDIEYEMKEGKGGEA